ncbi:MAG: tRNA (adenosine(37)-N6)-dimethylallyltransferase MiaA [Nitrospirae bacterium]|nr:tRNA (adenosine(37)-N6)-dimethylallyltransferase MiaA [Nitrospirota bacterium]
MFSQAIFLIGPTAVGKTQTAILLAKNLDTEIISADSMQIYRGMDIGTAKPSKDEREVVRHHMIDIVEPTEDFSVGEYLRRAREVIKELSGKGKIPLIVGGTGLYIKALTRGLFEGPKRDKEFRRIMELDEEKHGKGYLHNRLKEIDPLAASKIHPSDIRRIIRALEVYHSEKRPITELQENKTVSHGYNPMKIGLTMDRKELYRRIERRVDWMVSEGLENEVRALINRGCHEGMTSMQGLGYRHFLRYFKGEYGLDEAIRLLKRDTKRYAKRQFTWFRKEAGIEWIDITGHIDPVEILGLFKEKVERIRELL